MPGGPRGRGEVGEPLDGNVRNARQDPGQVPADRNLQPPAGLHDGRDGRHFRPGVLTADMDPVLPAIEIFR